jgi:hypothetical protein
MPEYFITGGQTGASSIPLILSEMYPVKTKGCMPKRFKRDDGRGEEIALRYNLSECDGSYQEADTANALSCDALMAFLQTKPLTGRGTMQTVSLLTHGIYRWKNAEGEWDFYDIECPEEDDHGLKYRVFGPDRGGGESSTKPVLVLWDLNADNISKFAFVVKDFLDSFKPNALMFAGPTSETCPSILADGVCLFLHAFS